MSFRHLRFPLAVFAAALSALASAQSPSAPPTRPPAAATVPAAASPSYRLGVHDVVRVAVFEEPDLAAEQRLDEQGQVRLPLLGTLRLAGLSLREAEQAIERAYVDGRFLRKPQVAVTITSYRPREVIVRGQVGRPGKVSFPAGAEVLDLLQVIALAGDFTAIARTGSVRVTRIGPNGQAVTADVDMNGAASYRVLPGDVIEVATRVF